MSAPALWTIEDMAAAMSAERQGSLPATISGLSIDTRTIGEGEASDPLSECNRQSVGEGEQGIREITTDRR